MFARLPAPVCAACVLCATAYLSVGLARWEKGDLATLVREARREEAMARRIASTRRLSDGKHGVVNEAIAGRITLRQAAEQFRQLNAQADDGNDDLVGPYWVVSGEERLCRNVLVWVRAELYHHPDRAAGVLARLGAEYRERFGHGPDLGELTPP
jgi:hypothetical protein